MTKSEIELILYCREASEACQGLRNTVSRLFPERSIQLYRTCETFMACLGKPGTCCKMAVILIHAVEELEGFFSMRDRLRRRPCILILPHTGQDLMIRALALRPKYIGTVQDNFTDVYQVMEKILTHHNPGGNPMAEALETIHSAIKNTTMATGKYLTFTLDNEEYGIGILKVKEIIGMMPVTQVPRTPDFVKGVINLRGKVIPVVDLRAKFEMDTIPYTERTCIIVVEIDTDAVTVLIGIVVDAVSEVLNIREDEIEPPPTFGTKLNNDFILGMAKMDGGVKILLNIDQVLSSEEIATIEKVA